MTNNIFLIAILVLLSTSCKHKHDHESDHDHDHEINQNNDHDHDHDSDHDHELESSHNHEIELDNESESDHEHEDVKLQIIAYSNEFELFAEADPFVVGKTSNVLSHFSNLPDFTALEVGSITIQLIVNGEESSQSLDKSSRKGIYSFDIKPIKEGTGVLIFSIKTEEGEFQLKVPEVKVFDDEHDAIHAAEDAELSAVNAVAFTKEQSWKIDFATEMPKKEAFGQIIKTTAKVLPAQDDELMISAKTNGIVMLSTNDLLEGTELKKGQQLFSISGSELADNNFEVRYKEAQSNFEKAKSDYERSKELAKDKIVSEKDLLTTKNQYENAKVNYDNLRKNFNSLGQNGSSPLNGFVKQVFVQNGMYVESGQAIMSITKNEALLLRAEVQQKYAPILDKISSASIRTLYNNHTYTLEELNGKVLSYGRTVSKDNYLIPVNLQIDNNGSFVSGGFVEVYLKTLNNSQALTIPNSALLEEQGVYFVFVQIHPELFEKREIKIGASDGLRTEILEGLLQNQRCVNRGALLIKLAQATGALDAHSGHVH